MAEILASQEAMKMATNKPRDNSSSSTPARPFGFIADAIAVGRERSDSLHSTTSDPPSSPRSSERISVTAPFGFIQDAKSLGDEIARSGNTGTPTDGGNSRTAKKARRFPNLKEEMWIRSYTK